ncbi:MAG: Fic family protein [Gordonia sp. (in: high G+C Gram-positive bacteria)]|uniref:Fic/DOC family protein n=1 Tax=Gordonia sp. (in: high G+C Gram-positive bacteria) TaxID=84139 RepID=UPI0039E3E542
MSAGAARAIASWVAAAQRLEGWAPTPDETTALVDLAAEDITVQDYLAQCRHRYVEAEPPRSPVLARRRPYLIRGTDVLQNNLGLHTQRVLTSAEHAISAGRAVRLLAAPPGTVDVTDVHRSLFADVYPWAGEPRTIEIAKPGVRFRAVDELDAGLARVHRDVAEAWVCAAGYDRTAMAHRLAQIYADYNHVHPFREGNGRTGTLVLQLIAMRAGLWLDLSGISRDEWVGASRESIERATIVGPAAEPLRALFEPVLVERGAGPSAAKRRTGWIYAPGGI